MLAPKYEIHQENKLNRKKMSFPCLPLILGPVKCIIHTHFGYTSLIMGPGQQCDVL